MDVARSGARVFRDPEAVNQKYLEETIPRDRNTSRSPPIFNYPVLVGGGTSVSPTSMGSQYISSPSGPIGPVEVRNAQPFHTSINGNSDKHGYPTPSYIKLIGRKLSDNSSADIYLHFRVNFTHDDVLAESPNFMNLGISSVHT